MKYVLLIIIFSCTIQYIHAQEKLHALLFTSKEMNRLKVGEAYDYHFTAFDSAKGNINFSVNNLPSWLSYHAVQQIISGKAEKAGQYFVDITASTKNDTVHQKFMLTVYNKQTTNILCLGNSITNGTATFNSYRRDLWHQLHDENYNVDFIGSWNKHHMGGDVPNADFDMDHEGHSGWTFEDILKPPSWDDKRGNLRTWIQTYTPDIVLLELGTNDVFHCRTPQQMFGNLSVIVWILREKNPHVKIFLVQIPPLGNKWDTASYCGSKTLLQKVVQLNNEMPSFVKKYNTNKSPIFIVDQFTGVDAAHDTYDGIHPNDAGEKIMAERWFEAIKPYLKKI